MSHAFPPPVSGGQPADGNPCGCILIGASAGGPEALSYLLQNLPARLRVSILIIQHVEGMFIREMRAWLQSLSQHPVLIPRDGEILESGVVYLAGPGGHLVFRNEHTLGYTHLPEKALYRPSIDALFESAAFWWRAPMMALILTGMGTDGSAGLRRLRDAGHLTIAQDTTSAALRGMPQAAADENAACEILLLKNIPARIEGWLEQYFAETNVK